MSQIIGGGGNKDAGSGGGLAEDPDSLISVQQARFIDLIGEGPIVGLVNNEFSIYLDGVPLRDLSGTPNYKPFSWDFRSGTQSQTPMPGFTGTQQETAVGLKILQSMGRVIRTISDADADGVRVTASVNGLTNTSAADGKVFGTSVVYKLSARKSGGSWKDIKTITIDGKTRSKYQRAYEFLLTDLAPGPFEIGFERVTADSASALLVNDIYWDSYTVLNYEKYAYPNSALVGVSIDARYFSQIPVRSYHVKGLLVKVPQNYDPVSRTYATVGVGTTGGAWDGTFKIAYTNNPAWCYYDIARTARYGLGDRIDVNSINKFDLYTIGRYCDSLVPGESTSNISEAKQRQNFDARGNANAGIPIANQNLEPRFTLNCVLNTHEEAYKVLNQLSSVFRGMTYWSNSQISVAQDRPTDPSMLFTNANVKDGMFNYEGSSRHQRNTVVLVAWNDPLEDFKQKWEYCEDRVGIARYGVKQTEMVAFGCTSRTQARRVGLWLLYTQRLESDMIKWHAGQDASFLLPGNTVMIMDKAKIGVRLGGRISSATTTAVTIDAPVTLVPGSYTLSVMHTDGTILTRTVTIATGGDYTVLPVTVAYATAPLSPAMWTLASTAVSMREVRVVGLREVDKDWIEITGIQHENSKFDAIELAAPLSVPEYSLLTTTKVPAIVNLIAFENSFKKTVTSAVQSNLDISWDASSDPMVRGYLVRITGSDGSLTTYPEQRNPYINLTNLVPGIFKISVSAVNHFSSEGAPTLLNKTVTGVDATPPADVVSGTMSYVVEATNGVRLKWVDIADYIDFYEIRLGATWATATLVAQVKANNHIVGLQAGTSTYLVKAVDTSGNYSVNAGSIAVTVTAPSAPTVSYALAGVNEVLSWNTPSSAIAIDHYNIKTGATFGAASLLDTTKGSSYSRKVDYLGDKNYYVTAVDAAGVESSPATASVSISAPGPVTAYRSEVVDNNALLFWAAPSTGSMPIDHYEVRKGATWAGGTVVGNNADSTFCSVFEQAAGTYSYWITAYDAAGNIGTPIAILATVSQPPDYKLQTNIDSTFSGTLTNMIVDQGTLLGPVNTSEDWSTHFSSHSWTTPQDQITAGFPIYLNPSLTSGSYDESFDAGTILPSTTIVATLGSVLLTGTVTAACQLYTRRRIQLTGTTGWTASSANVTGSGTSFLTEAQVGDVLVAPNGSSVTIQSITNNTALVLTANYGGTTVSGQTTLYPWTAATAGATSVLVSNFRYYRVVWTFTATAGANLIQVTSLNMKLSSKLKNDSGTFVITNATSGVVVNFNVAFIDADTPIAQANGTTPLTEVVDFTDVPNPTSFTVYLYNNAGTKVTGSGSWTARGY